MNGPFLALGDPQETLIGGVRDSGWGRTGPCSLADFTDLIWINVQSGQRHRPIS
ncbi:hypothetical protein [Kutzneria sp. NPDC052558]|uniref:hypothetical protein n=1 Tax=Kutzneria sp. NPDC052558 TaxID=3364121 RepID=UPI0037C83AE8